MGLSKLFKKFGVNGSSFKELINNISNSRTMSSTKLKYLRQVNKEVGNRPTIKKQLNTVKKYYNDVERTKKEMKKETLTSASYERLGKKWKHDFYIQIKTNVMNKDKDGENKKFPMTIGFSEKELEGKNLSNKWQIAELAKNKLTRVVNQNAEKYGFTSDDQISKFDIDIFQLDVTVNQNRTDYIFEEVFG